METGPRFLVPSDGLKKPGIEPETPVLKLLKYEPAQEKSVKLTIHIHFTCELISLHIFCTSFSQNYLITVY